MTTWTWSRLARKKRRRSGKTWTWASKTAKTTTRKTVRTSVPVPLSLSSSSLFPIVLLTGSQKKLYLFPLPSSPPDSYVSLFLPQTNCHTAADLDNAAESADKSAQGKRIESEEPGCFVSISLPVFLPKSLPTMF